MFDIALQLGLGYNPSNIWEFILFNPLLQIFYFGIFTGGLFFYIKDNTPNRLDVLIGKRVGNVLRIHTWRQPSDKKEDMTYKGSMYYFDNADIKLTLKHGLFDRPMYIFDEDNLTPIKTTKPNVPIKITTTTITNKKGEQVVVTTKKKSTNYPLDIDLDTQWNISARKIYNWWKNKMMETTWRAIIGKTIAGDMGQTIMLLVMGIAMGALAMYAIEPYHVIPIIQHITNSTSTK